MALGSVTFTASWPKSDQLAGILLRNRTAETIKITVFFGSSLTFEEELCLAVRRSSFLVVVCASSFSGRFPLFLSNSPFIRFEFYV